MVIWRILSHPFLAYWDFTIRRPRERKAAGLCVDCGKVAAAKGVTRCEDCALFQIAP